VNVYAFILLVYDVVSGTSKTGRYGADFVYTPRHLRQGILDYETSCSLSWLTKRKDAETQTTKSC
jgi:hypothetical protein